MPTEMKLWEIKAEHPSPVPQEKLNLESRIEEWLVHDIGLVSNDLLVVGQQVETAYGKFIDLLAVDDLGNLVILELKRDKTPRDVVAQALDYASWVQDLGHDAITEMANGFLKVKTLEQAFREKFQKDLPDVLNERHRMYIVAASLDSATERIVKYLSETHNVDINVATFAYFKTEQGELLGRSLLLDEVEVTTRAELKSKRNPPRSWEELHVLAEQKGVAPLYDKALSELRPLHDGATRSRTTVALFGYMGEAKAKNSTISICPDSSSVEKGLALMVGMSRVCEYFGLPMDKLSRTLGPPAQGVQTYDPNATWFFDDRRLDELVHLLTEAKQSMSNKSIESDT